MNDKELYWLCLCAEVRRGLNCTRKGVLETNSEPFESAGKASFDLNRLFKSLNGTRGEEGEEQ